MHTLLCITCFSKYIPRIGAKRTFIGDVFDIVEHTFACVVDTGDQPFVADISANFLKIRNSPEGILMAWEESDSFKKPDARISCQKSHFNPAFSSLFFNLGKLLNWEEDSAHWEDCGSVARYSVPIPHTATSGNIWICGFFITTVLLLFTVVVNNKIGIILTCWRTYLLSVWLTWCYPGQKQSQIVMFLWDEKDILQEMLGLRLENPKFVFDFWKNALILSC